MTAPAVPHRRGRDTRITFVAASGAAAWVLLASMVSMIEEGGKRKALGALAPYAASAPFVVSSALLLVAVLALGTLVPDSEHRAARRALALGAALAFAGACCSVAESVLLASSRVVVATDVPLGLPRAAAILGACSYVCYGTAVLRFASRTQRRYRRALGVLGVGLLLGACSEWFSVVTLFGSSLRLVDTLRFAALPTFLFWSCVAFALLSLARRFGARASACLELGAVAAALLALATSCNLLAGSVELARPLTSVSRLVQAGAEVTCLGWGVAAATLLLAAARRWSPRTAPISRWMAPTPAAS